MVEAIVLSPEEEADLAGLVYIHAQQDGYTRKKLGRGFRYYSPRGEMVRAPHLIERFNKLVIPPAWKEVWICPDPMGHLQATGRDEKGRKQYRYHPRWREQRDSTKYDRMIDFGHSLPEIRGSVETKLRAKPLSKDQVVSTVIRLLERTLIRVGNEEYAKTNGSYGLTTMRDQHVEVDKGEINFAFKGKSGVQHKIKLKDRRLATIVARCQDLPGQILFQYLDDAGEPRAIGSGDVNEFLRGAADHHFTAKDFRTWFGSVLAASTLKQYEAPQTKAAAQKNIRRAIESVSAQLRNTVAVCKKCYVHPLVIEAYLAGELNEEWEETHKQAIEQHRERGLSHDEAYFLMLLEMHAARQKAALEQEKVVAVPTARHKKRRPKKAPARKTRPKTKTKKAA